MSADESVPLPDYEVSQYFPQGGKLSGEKYDRLRDEYGPVRAYFKTHPEKHVDLQRWLNQGRFGTTYDVYLTRSVRYSVAAAGVGVLLGVLLTWLLASMGVLASLQSPFQVNRDLAVYVSENRLLFGGAALVLVSTAGLGAGTYWLRYYYPKRHGRPGELLPPGLARWLRGPTAHALPAVLGRRQRVDRHRGRRR
jgi:flagellar protein FlaJ